MRRYINYILLIIKKNYIFFLIHITAKLSHAKFYLVYFSLSFKLRYVSCLINTK